VRAGKFGLGDLGPGAFRLIDQLAKARQSIWQILPLGPTGYGDSPYQCFSAFAGNPLFLSLERLIEDGLLPKGVLRDARNFPSGPVDFERVKPHREARLHEAFQTLLQHDRRAMSDFDVFCEQHADWLDDYALFMALRDQWPDRSWTSWPEDIRSRKKSALTAAKKEFAEGIAFHKFLQHQFFRQWADVRAHAHERGVEIMGDVPIFVSHESADVWADQSQFQLDAQGRPLFIAGVPPDYFSATGQRWGNPLYRWDRMQADGFRWWLNRLSCSLALVDLIRLDHFRGFEAYWEIPAASPTAASGRWVQGPGAKLFETLRRKRGELPIIAEDLGLITAPVEQLRDQFGFPGMRVLQFGFGGGDNLHLPHNYVPNCVAYTGTHDNDTSVGWFQKKPGRTMRSAKQAAAERNFASRYLHTDGSEIHWDLIRAVWGSVAETAIAPVQDVLGLDSSNRMNMPGTSSGNWRWRLEPGQLNGSAMARLAEMTELYGRSPATELLEA
jgi:4-alpha-glucanotransferase